jgi:HSP20 family molecular chaperone IbpA
VRSHNLSSQEEGRGAGARAVRAIRDLYSGEAPEWLPTPTQEPPDLLGLDAELQRKRAAPPGDCKVRSSPTEVTVVADLPGVRSAEVVFEVRPGRVKICTDIRVDPNDPGGGPLWQLCRDIRRGRFEQTVQIPDGLRVDGWSATFEDGVLRVRIPRAGRHRTPERGFQH